MLTENTIASISTIYRGKKATTCTSWEMVSRILHVLVQNYHLEFKRSEFCNREWKNKRVWEWEAEVCTCKWAVQEGLASTRVWTSWHQSWHSSNTQTRNSTQTHNTEHTTIHSFPINLNHFFNPTKVNVANPIAIQPFECHRPIKSTQCLIQK